MTPPPTKAERIREFLRANPTARNKEACAALGVTQSQVSTIRREMLAGAWLCQVGLNAPNTRFIAALSERSKVTPREMLDAIVTDARLEEAQ